MARPPKREMRDRTFRCLDEDFLFTAKMEYLGHDAGEEGGPNDPTHRIELVEE